DGTYFHSGLLAIRQSIAAGVNITYKILYNDAVAMTGGQQVGERPEGHSVLQIMQSLVAEGVRQLVIVSDEPEKYQGVTLLPGVTVHHRKELDSLQRRMRETAGCTAIIYDQTCATEKRRRRKRGTLATKNRAVIINELVCEGCGDCSFQSNCLSVEPIDTEFGRKRRINHNSCNQDFSCIDGFCPSFVTVEGGQLKKPQPNTPSDTRQLSPIPEPHIPDIPQAWGIVVAGVGGTGVITIGSLLGMAAHLEGKAVITQDAAGLAQKGGATWSHIQIANHAQDLHTTKVDVGKADLVLGCDPIVTAHAATLSVVRAGRTYIALNTHTAPTAALIHNPDWRSPHLQCSAQIAQAAGGTGMLGLIDADTVAVRLLGDSIYANPLLLGFAWQKGRIPLRKDSLLRAMELNGAQVQKNQSAFEWGRRCAHDWPSVQALSANEHVIQWKKKPSLPALLAQREAFLTAYQNTAYARAYRDVVDKVWETESILHSTQLSEAVARYLFKLMAYKDEYEVARLHTDPAFTAQIAAQFEGDYRLVHHLAPPLWVKKDPQGRIQKRAYGPSMRWMMRALAHGKGLRGSWLDPFGHSEERRHERDWIVQYRTGIEQLLTTLRPDNLALAVQIARVPEGIRGYGHIKERHMLQAQQQWETLWKQWNAS
ncbi:MAG: indolepyruvate ferredoxin oxidoreductase family protein, partial [Comamonas sp.]